MDVMEQDDVFETLTALWRAYKRGDHNVVTSVRCYLMFVWMLATAFVMNIGNEMADRNRPDSRDLLPDLVLDNVDPEFGSPFLADYLVGVHVLIMLYVASCSSISTVIARRFYTIYGALNLFRALTISLTQLPDPSPRCARSEPSARAHVLLCALRMMFPMGLVTCGDLIFSGHSVIIVLTVLFWIRYYPTITLGPVAYAKNLAHPVFSIVVKYGIVAFSSFSLYCIIATRLHYTTDVAIAIYITFFAVQAYERAVRSPWIRTQSPFLCWLEAYVDLRDRIVPFEHAVLPMGVAVAQTL